MTSLLCLGIFIDFDWKMQTDKVCFRWFPRKSAKQQEDRDTRVYSVCGSSLTLL